jgi:hypothetical protein
MATETQQHPVANGFVNISRNGNHQYWLDDGPRMKSVTTLLRHIEPDSFGIGLNWGLKMVRENDGDMDAPKRMNASSIAVGNALHEAVDAYIQHGTIDEEDQLFLSWFNAIGESTEWLASERFLYHPELLYGGTLDQISITTDGEVVIHDLKSVEPLSWAKYGSSLRINKDTAQIAAYCDALTAMGSIWSPTKGYITYVLRDGSGAEVEEVDLERGSKLFQASRELYRLTQGGE